MQGASERRFFPGASVRGQQATVPLDRRLYGPKVYIAIFTLSALVGADSVTGGPIGHEGLPSARDSQRGERQLSGAVARSLRSP